MQFSPDLFFDLSSYAHKSLFDDCEHAWEALARLEAYLKKQPLGRIECEVPQGAWIINPHLVSIGEGSTIEPGAYIQGPALIGKNCTIRHGAYIRGQVLTGDACVIGHATEVKHSIFLNHAHAAHFAYVGDSILGNHVNLGAGVKLANLKLDNRPVIVHANGKRIETGLRKLGSILGDGAQLGCNSVTNPGTLMGKKSISYPCKSLSGYITAS